MATWTSSVDVLADLDMLAEFPDGCIYTKDIPIVSYSSYGRGSYLEEEPSSGPPSPLCNMVGEADFQLPPSFESGTGRGERILALSRQQRDDVSLQRQLRMAMGPGYSNELIENFIRGEFPSDHSEKVGQFDDAQEGISSSEARIDDNAEERISSIEAAQGDSATDIKGALPSGVEPKKVESSVSDTPTKHWKPKKSLMRNRNALLNSLPNYNRGLVMESDNKSEIETSSQIHDNHSCEHVLTDTYPVSDSFKSRAKDSFPIQVERVNLNNLMACVKKTDNTFRFKEEDFPPLYG